MESAEYSQSASTQPSFREALRYWIKLGFINFGGPAGQIAIMHKDIVDQRKWVSEAQFLRALNFCMILPGPEATQLATYIGWRLHGIWGGLLAGLWFILPSIVVLWFLSWMLVAYGDVLIVAGVLYGVQPVVIAIVVEAVLRIGKRALHHRVLVGFAAAAFIAIYFLGIPFPLIIIAAAALGMGLSTRLPEVFRTRGHGTAGDREEAAQATPKLSRAVGVMGVFLLLWLAPVGLLFAWQGADGTLTQLAIFFTGAAFVTFGGAYAVLSYVSDAAVNVYGWLGPGQMVHGLALAESTPGPLIMVTQYVGFLGAWRFPEELPPLAAATIGALTVTYVTFLPCFMFIFVGAPYMEALASNRRLQAALTGVTAAIVGVILNLAVFFSTHVLFPERWRLDVFALVLAVAAFMALKRLRWQIHTVVIAGAVIGAAWVLGGDLVDL